MAIPAQSLSRRMGGLRPSTIREILKVTAKPEVISFAGGLPAPELFPVEAVRAAADYVLATAGSSALQYAPSEGFLPLREWIAAEMAARGIACSPADLLVTVGSQQVLDLVGKLFLNPGDTILTENPTYLAAVQAFQVFEARFVPVPTDAEGLVPEALPELIAKHRPKFLYTIPNFQNPTGTTLSLARRQTLARVAAEHGLTIVEDDPYGKLRYRGSDLPPVRSFDTDGRVLYASTFSKTVAPGLRVGWVCAPADILGKLVVLKQASDLHTSTFDQRVIARYLETADVNAHLETIRRAYGERFDAMDRALTRELPKGFSWTHPEGGMFLWVSAPQGIDTLTLLERAIARDLVFVPGRDFFPAGGGDNFLRLNFSNSTRERIDEGMRRLGQLLS